MGPTTDLETTARKILANKEFRKEYDNYTKNSEWLKRNWKRIAREHAGKIVIIFDNDIHCSTEDADEARSYLSSLDSPVEAYVRYIPAANEALLL